jgi:hypothetical protein
MTRIRLSARLRSTVEAELDRLVRRVAVLEHDPGYREWGLDDDAPGMEMEIIVRLVPMAHRRVLGRKAAV